MTIRPFCKALYLSSVVAAATAVFGVAVPTAYATNEPTITLLGADPMVIPAGETYEDPGATATDTEDGELTVYSTADEFEAVNAGTYVVSYTATDADGNPTMAHRTVTVQDPEDYYGSPTGVERRSNNRVRVTYANGDQRSLTLPVSNAKKIALTASRDCIAFLSGTKKTMLLANPYTGERASSIRVRKNQHLTTATKTVDMRARRDRLDEIFVATVNDAGVLKLSAVTMHQRTHNLKKRGSVSVELSKTPQRLQIRRNAKTISVRNGKGKVLLKAVYTRNKNLKKK